MYRLKLWVFLLPVVFAACSSAPPAEPIVITPEPVEQPVVVVEQPADEPLPVAVEQPPPEPPVVQAVVQQPPAVVEQPAPQPEPVVQEPAPQVAQPQPAARQPAQQPAARQPAAQRQQPAAQQPAPPPVVEDPKERVPDIYKDLYDPTLSEIQIFAQNHDAIVRAKDYNGWKNNLTEERFEEIASAAFLSNASQSPLLSSRRVVLRTANDYFDRVVVPSHSSTRVDEIEFITENNVKVFFITSRAVRNAAGEARTETLRLRLYELIKIDGAWKIVN